MKMNKIFYLIVSNIMENTEKKYSYLTNCEENRTLLQREDKCDKYDYIAAVACGVIGDDAYLARY